MATVAKRNAKRATKKAKPRIKPTGVCVGAKVLAKPLYTPNEVAEILGIGRTTVADKMDAGLLKYEKSFETPELQAGTRKRKAMEIRRIPYDELLRVSPSLAKRMIQPKIPDASMSNTPPIPAGTR